MNRWKKTAGLKTRGLFSIAQMIEKVVFVAGNERVAVIQQVFEKIKFLQISVA